jgi:hypothetical protein
MISHHQLDVLVREVLESKSCKRASDGIAVLLEQNPAHLAHLLRDHEVEQVEDWKELQFRDDVDTLLHGYAILEIGFLVGLPVPSEERGLRRRMALELGAVALRRYYERYYPLRLPEALRLRLDGELALRVEATEGGPDPEAIFRSFVTAVRNRRDDDDIEMFLWFLDDGFEAEEGLPDLRALVASPHALAASLAKPPVLKSPVDHAAAGLLRYVEYCGRLLGLLERAAAYPLLQSALWHLESYWFSHRAASERVPDLVTRAIGSLAGAEDGPAEVEERHAILRTLADPRFARPLADRLDEDATKPRRA